MRQLLFVTCSLLAILPTSLGQTAITDPTTPLRTYSSTTVSLATTGSLNLEAIISSDNNRFAIINGTRYKVGAIVDGASIQEINKSNVVLGRKNQQWRLSLGEDLILQGGGND